MQTQQDGWGGHWFWSIWSYSSHTLGINPHMCLWNQKSHSSACAASLKAWSYSKNGRTNGNVLSLSALRVSYRNCPGEWWIHWSTSACRENVSPVLHTMSSVTDSFVTVATFLYEHIMCAWLYAHTHCIVLHRIVTHISSLCDLKYVVYA